MKSSLTIWLFNFDYFPDVDGKKENDKNEDDGEKIGENEFNFWILHIKIRLYDNFHENQWEKCFRPYCRTFWLIEAKMKMKMTKYGKLSPIFEFSLSKKVMWQFSWKSEKKFFDSSRQKQKWRWKNLEKRVRFLNLHIKIRLYRSFHQNLRKKFFFRNF